MVFIASGMLVTGASGAGKSMIVKQVAKELSLDPRSLTRKLINTASLSLGLTWNSSFIRCYTDRLF